MEMKMMLRVILMLLKEMIILFMVMVIKFGWFWFDTIKNIISINFLLSYF
jgi:hypothetical protein